MRVIKNSLFVVLILSMISSLDSCNKKANVLIVTENFWWEINNRNNQLIKNLKINLGKADDRFSFEIREISKWDDLKGLLRNNDGNERFQYGYYVFTPVVSKWVFLQGRNNGWQNSVIRSFIIANPKSNFVFLLTRKDEQLSGFANVIQVVMEEETVFSQGAQIVEDLLKSNSTVRKIYKDIQSPAIGVIYYTIDGRVTPRIEAFKREIKSGGVLCVEKQLGSIENKIKARLAFEELRASGIKFFLFDAYSLNAYLISLAEKENVIYIVNYVKDTSLNNLLFSFDFDYAKLIGEALLCSKGLTAKGSVREKGDILSESGFIWWGNYIKIPKRYENNGTIKG